MTISFAVYEDEFYDSDDVSFQKTARKDRGVKRSKDDSIRRERKAKDKQREYLSYKLGNN